MEQASGGFGLARYVKGDIVSVRFPYSSDDDFIYRPEIVLASWPYLDSRDYLVCMISTQDDHDPFQMEIHKDDTVGGAFQEKCYVRPPYTFAASERRMQRKICSLKAEKLSAVLKTLHDVVGQ